MFNEDSIRTYCVIYVNYGSERFPYAWTDNPYAAQDAISILHNTQQHDISVETYENLTFYNFIKKIFPLFGVSSFDELDYYYKLQKFASRDKTTYVLTTATVLDKYQYDMDLKLNICSAFSRECTVIYELSQYMIDPHVKAFMLFIFITFLSKIFIGETLDNTDLNKLFDVVKLMIIDQRYLFEL